MIVGGVNNTVLALMRPLLSFPAAISNSVAGNYSLAAGNRAQALHDGAFVWADATGT